MDARQITAFTYNTCGWVSGSKSLQITCGNNRYCNSAENDYNVLGCCNTAITVGTYSPWQCDYFTACIPYSGAAGTGLTPSADGNNYGVRSCSDPNYPYCSQYRYPGDTTSSQWICSTAAGTSDASIETHTPVAGAVPASVLGTPTQTSGSSASLRVASGSSTSAASLSSSTSAVKPESEPATQIGAMAGGVVGGVGALLLIFAAFFFWRRHQRKAKTKKEAEATQPFPQTQDPTSGSTSGVPMYLTASIASESSPQTYQTAAPGIAEADAAATQTNHGRGDHSHSSSTTYMYKPYLPNSNPLSAPAYGHDRNSQVSTYTSFNQSRSHVSHPLAEYEMRPISEVQGSVVSQSQSPTRHVGQEHDAPGSYEAVGHTSQDRHELEGLVQMSPQAGPIPDWR